LKIANFSYPTLIWRPFSDVLYMVLRAFVVKFTTKKLVMGLPHDRSLSHFDTTPACDRQTDVRIYYSSYGVLLMRCKKHYICDHMSSSNALFITL